MTLEEFAEKVQKMRTSQKLFFQTRDRNVVPLAKSLEKEVDVALDAILGPATFTVERTR